MYDWKGIYIESVYFSFISMVTVGYGDIVPISKIEKITTLGLAIINCAMFAYTVNTIG